MDPELIFVFYLAGVICLLASAFDWGRGRFDLLALGLALVFIPPLWQAAENAF
jgi:hypothetical protein